MDIDYNKLDGYKIEDPIGKTMLQSLWEDSFKDYMLHYKSFDDFFDFMQHSATRNKISSFGFDCFLNKKEDHYLIKVTVVDFNQFKNIISIIVDRKDFDSSTIGEIERYKDQMAKELTPEKIKQIETDFKQIKLEFAC